MPEGPKYYHWPPEVFLAIADRIEELGEDARSVRFYPPRGAHEGILRVVHDGITTQSHEEGHEEECDPDEDPDCFNATQTCPPVCD